MKKKQQIFPYGKEYLIPKSNEFITLLDWISDEKWWLESKKEIDNILKR